MELDPVEFGKTPAIRQVPLSKSGGSAEPDGLALALGGVALSSGGGARDGGPVAVDATDRLLLDEVRMLLARPVAGAALDDVVVIGDRFGALAVGLAALGVRGVRSHTDAVTSERAVTENLRAAHSGPLLGQTFDLRQHDCLEPGLVRGARLVLLQLPRSLAELQEVAELVAREAADDVVLLAGGRVKHMTHAMNDVLGRSFEGVRATLARGKSRVLVARRPRPEARTAPSSYPVAATLRDAELLAAARLPLDGWADAGGPGDGRTGDGGMLDGEVLDDGTTGGRTAGDGGDRGRGVTVVAHGGVFAGASLDLGTRALLRTADRWPDAADAVDLGCGTGLLATVLALRDPHVRVVATDRSAVAAASARATARANGVGERVVVLRDDAGQGLEPASADLVLCNPPFHDRAAVSTDAAHRMFAAAARMLRPGGELWCVYNSVLRYRPALERTVGHTEQVSRDPRFTVTRSVRAAR